MYYFSIRLNARVRMKQATTLQERIITLEDLHRPLEEHWSLAKTKAGLDPRNSDFIYKHHITRLEDIYANQQPHLSASPTSYLAMTPVTQLYGVTGLKTHLPGGEERKKDKEEKWVMNFQKYRFLEEKQHDETLKLQRVNSELAREQQRERSPARPQRPLTASGTSSSQHKRHGNYQEEEDSLQHQESHIKKRALNGNLSAQELIMLGMYKFNEEQEEIYNKFVKMLTEFDAHDQQNVVSDAFHDAQSDGMLADYGGTDHYR